eukprot:m.606828 g.606828  ORF g.606828 m.606828 type:complete len:123 (-) comp22474_c0_seq10:189-557(-)
MHQEERAPISSCWSLQHASMGLAPTAMLGAVAVAAAAPATVVDDVITVTVSWDALHDERASPEVGTPGTIPPPPPRYQVVPLCCVRVGRSLSRTYGELTETVPAPHTPSTFPRWQRGWKCHG